ncbi:MAG: hypothetical protein P1U89_23365 [Verrucomicrobiales bacterium]|nr:hypothetical protein [Verrucomicrobiales bacterium]
MIVQFNKWKQLGNFQYRGFTLIEIVTGFLIFFVVGSVSFLTMLSIKKFVTGGTVVPQPIHDLPYDPSPIVVENSPAEWSLSRTSADESFMEHVLSIPASLNEIEPETVYAGEPKDLKIPLFSHDPGIFGFTQFPIQLSILNPNPSSTWIMVSVNGGKFAELEGESLSVQPGDKIEAYTRGDTREWNSSRVIGGTYISKSDGVRKPGRIPVRRISFKR